MNRTDSPKKQPIVFGVNGPRESLPDTTPSGDNTASYNSGFPPITMTLKSAGGLPPKGQDMNQILYELSALSRWSSTGAMNTYDSAFATSIGGYPSGSFILGDDLKTIYRCTLNGNLNNPNTIPTGWEKQPGSVVQGTGSSQLDVISQKGATDTFALKSYFDHFGGATLMFNGARDFSLQISDAGALSLYNSTLDQNVMAWSPTGTLVAGTVEFDRVAELKSAAKKDFGNGAGQIPDMSFFPLSGVGEDNLIAKFPNGLIIQVFRRLVNNSSTVGVPVVASTTYPTPFPSGLWGVFATKATHAQVSISCESATNTGFDITTVLNVGTGGSTSSYAYFIALGY
ncbi:TPA: hypothetical protein MO487_000317 [Salmonella enterica subsp. houtenae serovar 43:z4,z23:-]|nr:hypothetical protein [Salmonella enterica subsp. houtenae serovar 40:z4,z24:-]EGH3481612.1 hypothetical protein [Salmonella enterica]ELD7609518.1 hypothetical protein [Salmonella enterica]EMC3044715.1 hypothetical protein [Salmonella enterica]HCA3674571.1 hypothetical protein [Salmonella enterica subsp. houtenae serovar Houten]